MMSPMDEEALDQEAMGSMLAGGMGGDMEMVDVQVPAFAVPAVMELVAMLQEEMSNGGDDMMGIPPGPDPMGGGMMPPPPGGGMMPY